MNRILTSLDLQELQFDNRFVNELPADPDTSNSIRQVPEASYSLVTPLQVPHPQLVSYSREAAQLLDLSEEQCLSPLFLEMVSGNRQLPGMQPHAMRYGGHQFGSWAGQLGDGRAIILGEVRNRAGEHWSLQLKGSGLTPYSRRGDGLAVLRSSIREFLCSEAMHHLGIPTTRALSLITTGDYVLRDMFYDGHPQMEPGAVVCRLAPSFLRFGNFEIHASLREQELLERLVHFTISSDFPHLGQPSQETIIAFFHEVCRRTAELMVDWMRLGFVHGVMNTDNMSILGLTIDYGPYGWLESFAGDWTPNTTDAHGKRYSYANQPHIGQWNLAQLATALLPLIKTVPPLQEGLSLYNRTFERGWNRAFSDKLGLVEYRDETDDSLIGDLIDLLQEQETDMTIFFRQLANLTEKELRHQHGPCPAPLLAAYYQPESLDQEYSRRLGDWLQRYQRRLTQDNLPVAERTQRMNKVNPKYVLRNYLAQVAIDQAERGEYEEIGRLLDVLRHPYDEQPERENYAARRPEWARNKPGCSMLSCSS